MSDSHEKPKSEFPTLSQGTNVSAIKETTLSTLQSKLNSSESFATDIDLSSIMSSLNTTSDLFFTTVINITTGSPTLESIIPSLTDNSEIISSIFTSSSIGLSSIQEMTAISSEISRISAKEQSSIEISSPVVTFSTIEEEPMSTTQSQLNSFESVSSMKGSSEFGLSSIILAQNITSDLGLSYLLNSTTEAFIPSLSYKSESVSALIPTSSLLMSSFQDTTTIPSEISRISDIEQSSSAIFISGPNLSTIKETSISTDQFPSNSLESLSSVTVSTDLDTSSIISYLDSTIESTIPSFSEKSESITAVFIFSSEGLISNNKTTVFPSNNISSISPLEQSSMEISSPGLSLSTVKETTISAIKFQSNSSESLTSLKVSTDISSISTLEQSSMEISSPGLSLSTVKETTISAIKFQSNSSESLTSLKVSTEIGLSLMQESTTAFTDHFSTIGTVSESSSSAMEQQPSSASSEVIPTTIVKNEMSSSFFSETIPFSKTEQPTTSDNFVSSNSTSSVITVISSSENIGFSTMDRSTIQTHASTDQSSTLASYPDRVSSSQQNPIQVINVTDSSGSSGNYANVTESANKTLSAFTQTAAESTLFLSISNVPFSQSPGTQSVDTTEVLVPQINVTSVHPGNSTQVSSEALSLVSRTEFATLTQVSLVQNSETSLNLTTNSTFPNLSTSMPCTCGISLVQNVTNTTAVQPNEQGSSNTKNSASVSVSTSQPSSGTYNQTISPTVATSIALSSAPLAITATSVSAPSNTGLLCSIEKVMS